jgi:hypothetical protein
MQTQSDEELRKAYKITVIIGVFMMSSLLVYAAVVELIKKEFAPFAGFSPLPDDQVTMLRYALLGLAAVAFFLIRYLKRVMPTPKSPSGISQIYGQYSPEVQKCMTVEIVTFALCESVAIYGLVLFLIQGNSMDFYVFLLLSLFYFAIYFPRFGTWEEFMKEKEKAERK